MGPKGENGNRGLDGNTGAKGQPGIPGPPGKKVANFLKIINYFQAFLGHQVSKKCIFSNVKISLGPPGDTGEMSLGHKFELKIYFRGTWTARSARPVNRD